MLNDDVVGQVADGDDRNHCLFDAHGHRVHTVDGSPSIPSLQSSCGETTNARTLLTLA